MSSKIRVDTIENVAGSGNVSLGSGHNLVVPGNETVGGTLGVTGNVSTNGQLGLNTSGTGVTGRFGTGITVRRTVPEVHLKRDDGNGEGGVLLDNASSTQRLFVGTYNANQETHIGTNGTQRLIVNSSGYVTIPNQPFVRLRLASHINSSGTTINSPGNQVTGFQVIENVGGHWNSSNNNFTCPVAGVYQVSVFYIKYPIAGTAHIDLHKNGNFVNALRWRAPEAGNHYYQAGGTASLTCAANDVLDWHFFGTAGVHDTNGSWEIKLSH